MSRPFPLIEYARKIGKNTVEFTTGDMCKFMIWWMKQAPRKDLLEGTEAQKQELVKDIAKMKKWREEAGMKHTTASYHQAQTSRLAERGIESPINNGEEEIIIHEDKIVCTMELTQKDVAALLFSIHRTFADYEMEDGVLHTDSLKELKEGLEGV